MNNFRKIITLFLLLFSAAALAADDTPADKLEAKAISGDKAALAKLISGADSGDATYGKAYGDYFYEKKDYTQSLAWYKKAADQGNDVAQVRLGGMYEEGKGVPSDLAQAMVWYKKAADQGSALGQVVLGGAYERGIDGKRDLAKAMVWYRKAADQGDGDGAAYLGESYADLKDYANAIVWLAKGADRGSESAQEQLGYMYSIGHSGVVRKNEVIAYALYDLAHDDLAHDDEGLYGYDSHWHPTKAQIKTAKALEQRMSKIGVSAAIDEYLKSVHESK